ncbi:hypothetical protein Pcinc_029431 [Petrolisthes cinctipes]|uniref:Uncharacterized protein n=1 Tax=Petrolisthes cinctipes TaxID=88211 RepID=A0AAE1F109_PETCI|nr:hypothetical protein Pcinc_029431 [Petrolisthes cinctipes]
MKHNKQDPPTTPDILIPPMRLYSAWHHHPRRKRLALDNKMKNYRQAKHRDDEHGSRTQTSNLWKNVVVISEFPRIRSINNMAHNNIRTDRDTGKHQ